MKYLVVVPVSVALGIFLGLAVGSLYWYPQSFQIGRLELELAAARNEAALHKKVAEARETVLEEALATRDRERQRSDAIFDSYRACLSLRPLRVGP